MEGNATFDKIYTSIRDALTEMNPTEKDIDEYIEFNKQRQKDKAKINWDALRNKLIADLILYTKINKPLIFRADSDTDHRDWRDQEKTDKVNHGAYWTRYKRYLSECKKFSDTVISSIDEITTDILFEMENPEREGTWSSRGMVVGYIQSGKTANYTGLICKAADAGYKIIIILAGTLNDLRYQTQLRIDEGFLGSKKKTGEDMKIVGVGQISMDDFERHGITRPPDITCLTSSEPKGDFRKPKENDRISMDSTICLVIKKNTTVLKSVCSWLKNQAKHYPGEKFTDKPLLVVDDEADYASPNTRAYEDAEKQDEKTEITSTNQRIRELLNTSCKSAYVGYTATPFANIFIDPDAKSDNPEIGCDLFPRNYIITMPRPPGYFGSDTVFGGSSDETFPGIVTIDDDETMYPVEKRADPTFTPVIISESLKEAIDSFILAYIVRLIRNKGVCEKADHFHHSMLIHISRYVNYQGSGDDGLPEKGMRKLVSEYCNELKDKLSLSDEETLNKFKAYWEEKYSLACKKIRETTEDGLCTDVTWDDIKPVLIKNAGSFLGDGKSSILKIRVLTGKSGDVLDYDKYKDDGLKVIAIGGDKLSRGLTLEGLVTSYFIRGANAYDTLLQMGRWFGFRNGYVDLCRIYTHDGIIARYKAINDAEADLRKQIENMNEAERTPENYGLKVLMDPTMKMRVTAANKSRSAETCVGNPFSGAMKQSSKFQLKRDILLQNYRAVNDFISHINEMKYECNDMKGKKTGSYVWSKVDTESLLKFLQEFKTHPGDPNVGPALYDYIHNRHAEGNGELSEWTVLLKKSGRGGECKKDIAGLHVDLTIRNPEDPKQAEINEEFTYGGKHHIIINDIAEERIDLTEEEINVAYNLQNNYYMDKFAEYKKKMKKYEEKVRNGDTNAQKPTEPKKPVYGEVPSSLVRRVRSPKRGLLIIYPCTWAGRSSDELPFFGFACSLPMSSSAPLKEYLANKAAQEDEQWAEI